MSGTGRVTGICGADAVLRVNENEGELFKNIFTISIIENGVFL